MLTGSSRTWGGPAGVSLLVVRTGTRWSSPLPGDEPAPGRAPPLVLAAAVGLQAAQAEAAEQDARLRPLVERLRAEVVARVPGVDVVGDPDDRLPHVLTFSCLYVDGESLATALDRQGFAVSSGSACTSSTLQPSHVLAAMGALTGGNVRMSLHRGDDARRRRALPRRAAAGGRGPAGRGRGRGPAVTDAADLPAPSCPLPTCPLPTCPLLTWSSTASGGPCPVPVIELARALPTVGVGQVVEVLSDDPAARHDVPAWCRMRAQEYLGPTRRGQLVRRLADSAGELGADLGRRRRRRTPRRADR